MMLRRSFLAILAICFFATGSALADGKPHRLALQISDDSKQKMHTVLNVAANVSRYYSAKGEEVEIEIIAFNKGLHMLRPDTSPVGKRIKGFSKSMTNVSFKACGNTMKGMSKKEGKMPKVFEFAEVVPAGVIQLMDRDAQGWTIIRP